MAIIEDPLGVKKGKLGNVVVQGWKEHLIAKSHYGNYTKATTPEYKRNKTRFAFLMAEYKQNKALISQLYPLHTPFKFIWSQWISEQHPNTEYVNNHWQFITNPYNTMLTDTANKTEVTVSIPSPYNKLKVDIVNQSLQDHIEERKPFKCAFYTIQNEVISNLLTCDAVDDGAAELSLINVTDYPILYFWVQCWQFSEVDGSVINYWCKEVYLEV